MKGFCGENKRSWIDVENEEVMILTSTTKLAFESVCIEADVIPECEDSVETHEVLEPVLRMLPPDVPRFSRSPVLLCFLIFSP
ncbi:hypothetical protein LSTR_LSTR015548 [Laodelphax striatellus]|uniref:Uncharacterized protein n=1 Tax=Laodelphax striatellus TaxID=195883 RepID=A0A482WZN2_LAOST|nr:hypothetical protein LSTR_LSTR015548 [Laodelphax striatellus]